jgi:hypothetical protein
LIVPSRTRALKSSGSAAACVADGGDDDVREDVAQRVVDVDARRVEHRIAVFPDVHVGERRMRPAERHVAEAHVVADCRAEPAFDRELCDRMMRERQHKQHRRGDRDGASPAAAAW